jgi:hypothetical protein
MQGQLEEMQVEQRPWVKVDLEVASGLRFGETSATFDLRAKVQNVGHSPAFNLNFWPKAILWNATLSMADDLLKARCDEMTAQLFTMPMVAWGKLLFPGETDQTTDSVSIDFPKNVPPPAPKPPPPTPPISSIYPLVPGIGSSIVTAPNYLSVQPNLSVTGQPYPYSPFVVELPKQPLLLSCVYYESRSGPKRAHHTAESLGFGLFEPGSDPQGVGWIDLDARKDIPVEKFGLFRPWNIWRQ